jgi:hypothetical protein
MGEKGHFKSQLGFRFIQKLLRARGKLVPMVELLAAGARPRRYEIEDAYCDPEDGLVLPVLAPNSQSMQPVFDHEGLQLLQAEHASIRKNIAAAEKAEDFHLVSSLREEEQRLAAAVKREMGLGGDVRDINNPMNKWRPRIRRRLSDAFKAMRVANPPMHKVAAHLQASISAAGAGYIYSCEPCPSWILER